nr:MAG TPA: Keratinocyte-associated protein [Caudoviricetes sp.]
MLWVFYHILILFISLMIIYYVCLQHKYKIL